MKPCYALRRALCLAAAFAFTAAGPAAAAEHVAAVENAAAVGNAGENAAAVDSAAGSVIAAESAVGSVVAVESAAENAAAPENMAAAGDAAAPENAGASWPAESLSELPTQAPPAEPAAAPQDNPAPAAPAESPGTTTYTAFVMNAGAVNAEKSTVARGVALVDTRSYAFPDGSRLSMQRLRTSDAGAPAQDVGKLTLNGTSGLLRWYDTEINDWHVVPLKNGTYPVGTYHITTEQGSAVLVPPQVYIDHSNGMLEHLPAYNGSLVVTEVEGGFLFTLRTPALPANTHAEWFLLRSGAQLVDWNRPDSAPKWAIYSFTGENRWCMTGYYYLAPNTYYPAGANYYNNLPAAYIAGRMMRDEGQPASTYLGLAMLDVMGGLRNEEGYLPSQAGSTWLHDDYGIEPGYFDTRFNVDFATAQLNAVNRYHITQWTADLIRFGDYLRTYAEQHHFPFEANGQQGWLVQDYAHTNGNRPTHCSLNHHAAMAVFLYRLAELTGEQRFQETADLLTRGIELSESGWVKPDGDLYYAYMPDGSFDRADYAYLTYNDLLELQQYVTKARAGTPSAALNRLMASKRQWMDAHGVTDYNK